MSTYWLVVNHPYAIITDSEGRYRIENLPEGTHNFNVWHERLGVIERELEVVIVDGETTTLEPIEVLVQEFFEE